MDKNIKRQLKAEKALGSESAKKALRKHRIKKAAIIGGSVAVAAGAAVGGYYLYKHHEESCSAYTDNSFNY